MSLDVNKIDWSGKKLDAVKLSEDIFAKEIKEGAVHQSVTALLAARRKGTAKVKTRGEVAGGGKKPYRQKGTGNARHGTKSSPIFAGGGTVFGPSPRSYVQKLPKKVKRAALLSALTSKFNASQVFVASVFEEKKPSTKKVSQWMQKQNIESALFVGVSNKMLELSSRNIAKASYSDARSLNVFDVLKYKALVISDAALEHVNTSYGEKS